MPTNRRIFSQDAVSTGDASSAQGLVLHLDANDEDSIEAGGANQGDGSGTWFDIANHDLNVPLVDKASNLQLHLNASDTTSYSGSGGTWTDISGNTSNDGTIDGATFASDTRGYFTFDGSNDDIEIGASSNLVLGTVKTFEFWINAHTIGGLIFVRSNAGYSDYAYNFGTVSSSGDKLQVAVYNSGGSTVLLDRTVPITLNTFHHIVLTFADRTSGSAYKIYKDGTLASSGTISGDADNDTSFLNYIGSQGGASSFFDGDISAIRCYDVVLTASEVAQNFRQGNFLSYSSIYDTNLAMNLDAANYTSGPWADSAGSNNGTVNGASFDKELGNYFDFDGSNDTITVSATASAPVNFSSETHSIGLWANIETLANDKVLIGKFTTGSDRAFQIQIASSNKLLVLERGGGNFSIESTQSFTANTWFYFLYTRAASEAKIYVNGLLDTTASATQTINDAGTTDITIGNQAGTSEHFTGKIGQVKIYSSTLNPAQVAQNYLATKNNYPNGFNGTISGTLFGTNGSTPNEKYFDFSGATSHLITIPDNDLFDMQANSSMEIWLTKNTSGGAVHIINKKGGGVESWSLWSNATGSIIYFYAYNAAGNAATGSLQTSTTPNATWNHIIVTVNDALDYEIYLNGSSEATDTSLSDRLINSDTVKIGSYSGGNAYAGKVAMLKFHAKELSSSEVTANYNATKATFGL